MITELRVVSECRSREGAIEEAATLAANVISGLMKNGQPGEWECTDDVTHFLAVEQRFVSRMKFRYTGETV